MAQIDNHKINYLYELMHEIILLRYKDKKESYLKLMIELCNYLTDQIDRNLIDYSNQATEKIGQIEQLDYNSEEIRLVMQLLIINGLKHKNMSLDIMTPDGIGLLIAFIIQKLSDKKTEISILDVVIGTGNLILSIANYLDSTQVNLSGVDNNELFIQIAKANADMQYHPIELYFQDTLQHCFSYPDFIIADFDQYQYHNDLYQSNLYQQGIHSFPYLAIEKHILSGHEQTYHIYLIPNDFFNQFGNQLMKDQIEQHCEMKALIVLPESMFVNQNKSKNILILKNKFTDTKQKQKCEIIHLPSSEKRESFKQVINYIGLMLESF